MNVRYSRVALRQLDEILEYISTDNPDAARGVVRHISNSINALSSFPNLGRPTNKKNIRVLTVTRFPYLVFYVASNADITILRIRHGARKPEG